MAEYIYVGDYGVEIVLDTNIDLSAATAPRIYYQKPVSGDEGYWSAEISGQKVAYTLQSGDIDEAGWWKLHSYVDKNGPLHGFIVEVKALDLYTPSSH